MRLPSQPSRRCDLPIEFVLEILQQAQYDDLVPRYKWIKNYALVCRAWSSYAQQLLFAYVALLRGAEHCKSFWKIIELTDARDPEHAALLRGSVRTLGMVIDHQHFYADIVHLCPNLQELHLSLYHGSFRPEVLQSLAEVGVRLKALRVKTYHYLPLFQLLSLLPGLEYLEVDCNSVFGGALTIPPLSAPAWSLRHLRYANLRRHTHLFLEWALSGPGAVARDSLEVLEVISPSFDPSTIAALGIAPTLRSLTLQRLFDGDDLTALTSLQEISVVHPIGTPPSFRQLPMGLVHVMLGSIANASGCATTVAGLSEYHNRCDGSLRVLTYTRRCDSSVDQLTDVDMLHDFCEERGIEFRLMDPPYGFYPGERVPLKPAQSFPRDLPVSSRRPLPVQGEGLPWKTKRKATLARKIVNAASRAFGGTIPAVALAKP
uniref:Alcohol oxidase n=1 Tax=Ganoderma boninense TaxID=34458 RepID=A0A5K1JVU3_9APHY|nr:Alcohol oxidase [Ganoderma boninense]